MLTIIKERGTETITEKCLDIYNEQNELCMGFDLDNNDSPIINDCAKENYQLAMKKIADGLWSKRINTNKFTLRTDPIGKCKCGTKFEMHNEYLGACECPGCGQWYNLFGQELTPPDTWNQNPDW